LASVLTLHDGREGRAHRANSTGGPQGTGKAWGDDHALGTEYLDTLLNPYVGKNTGTNLAKSRPANSLRACPAGIIAYPGNAGYQQFLTDNDNITYVWNHI
jgi:hypothetical protein